MEAVGPMSFLAPFVVMDHGLVSELGTSAFCMSREVRCVVKGAGGSVEQLGSALGCMVVAQGKGQCRVRRCDEWRNQCRTAISVCPVLFAGEAGVSGVVATDT